MRCCADRRTRTRRSTAGIRVVAVLALLFASGLSAQDITEEQATIRSAGSTVAIGVTVEAEVAAAIAVRWDVMATVVAVELVSDVEWPAAGTPFRLIGSGDDGRWAVRFEEEPTARQLIIRAGTIGRTVTAARDIERGAELTAADLGWTTAIQWGSPRQDSAPVEAGWVTRRRIAQGEQIRRPAAEPPRAVKPGDEVMIEVTRGLVTLTIPGRAAGSAAIGEMVTVRAQTGKRIEGRVVAPGIVRIGSMREDR